MTEKEMVCLGDFPKASADLYRRAAAVSKLNVQWRDQPSAEWADKPFSPDFGSLWTDEENIHAFWKAVSDIREKEKPA